MNPPLPNAPALFLRPASASELLTLALDAAYSASEAEEASATAVEATAASTAVVVVVVASRRDFMASLTQDPAAARKALVAGPIGRTAATRDVRLLFAPTISHLRAVLTAFPTHHRPSLLLIYGLVNAHRSTSEWTARGLAATAAAAADAVRFIPGLRAVLVEPRLKGVEMETVTDDDSLFREELPVLGSADGAQQQVELGRVLGRWFQFSRGDWRL